jgi:hypothetical protein
VFVCIDRADRGLSNGDNFMVIGEVLIELRAFKNMSQNVNKKKATPRQSGCGSSLGVWQWLGGSVAVCLVWIDRADGELSNCASFVKFGDVLRDLRAFKNMSQIVTKSQQKKKGNSSSEWVRLCCCDGWLCGSVAVCVVWIDRADGELSNGASFVMFGAVLIELRAFKNMSQNVNKKKATSRQSGCGSSLGVWQWLGGRLSMILWYVWKAQIAGCRMVAISSLFKQY